ncbi:BQ2448_8121 [Microbotryum intermedium]|uniref:BQ2448_8121 protein n=1 Tax=Microbotryum intermedium TaxID=269621 RepID=A0A238FL30_9BASI|nr:BQ2448_8121 [Microbotryum intermedium]
MLLSRTSLLVPFILSPRSTLSIGSSQGVHSASVPAHHQKFRMSSSSSDSTKQLAVGGETDHGIQLEGKKAQVVQDVLDLFSAKFSKEILERSWARTDAIFADPIAYAEGYDQYSAQWAGMSIFESSETLAWKVTKNEPPILEYELRQRYVLPVTGQEKIMTSLVHIELDRNDKIVKLEDRWDGKPLPQGRVAKAMSDFSATYIVPALVNVDKVDKENKAKQ